jgi:glutathione S-transferase
MGDIPVGATLYRWRAIPGIERPELPSLAAWLARLESRPGFRSHVMLPLS